MYVAVSHIVDWCYVVPVYYTVYQAFGIECC